MEQNKETVEIDKTKLLYLLDDFFDDYLLRLVQEVLDDSEEDPQFSAVTAQNLLTCYLGVMTDLGRKLPYKNMQEYFAYNAFEPEEYSAFEAFRKKEAVYYRGPQF